ncbi:unnamed protein product [Urochloa humidicola]
MPSRAGEVFDWGDTTKKFTPAAAASHRRDWFGRPYYPLGRRADEIDDAIVLNPPKRDPSGFSYHQDATRRGGGTQPAVAPIWGCKATGGRFGQEGASRPNSAHSSRSGSPPGSPRDFVSYLIALMENKSDNSEASQLPKDYTSVLQNETKVRSKGQAALPIIARPQEAQLWLFSDHKEPPLKSAQAAAAQSARDGEDDAAAAAVAAAAGKIPELQAENLPEAKEAKQHLPPPRNHCQPILKGAPFIVCSTCLKLVQMPADFAISTDTVRKLRCGSCWAVLSYSYRDPGRNKPCHGSIDQLSTDMSELQVDPAPLLLEVFEELSAPRGGGKKVKEIQPERTQKGLGRIIAQSWQDVLHSGSGLPTPSIYQVEKSRPSFYKDVQAWFAMKNQYEGGMYHHACGQQVGTKLLCRNDIKKMIMEKLLLDRTGGSNCSVICINAGSGHGKTSLLHALYNDKLLTDTFDKRIWIQLSDKLDISTLFRKVVEGAMNDHCSITNLGCLQEMVKEEFTDKKFLFFLDDADIEDQQFWSTVLKVLNAGAKGSAVIMSTRSSTICTFMDMTAQSYFLNPLSEENNLMLLQQYAAMGTDIQSNPDFLMVAKRFISRFGSNPLNLKAIGGLLCHADSISLEMDKFEGSVMPLQLCHDVLPIHMKKCLAFCSLFPKGYIFDKRHIVLKWISHGCVRPVEGRELEDVGIEYFNELLCRSFFQYSPIGSDKDDKFVMHELMYKVVESVARDRYYMSENTTNSLSETILHLSLVSSQFQTIELMSKTEELKDLQTFLVVQPEWQPYKISFPTLNLASLEDFFLKFTSLQTLDLSHTDTEKLPVSIGGLRNLQYLSVNDTNIRSLPSELCSLNNLQTLEAKDCRFLTELPVDSKKLLKLRHLDVTKELDYVHLPHGIGHLTELRTLPVFHASGDPSRCSISELGNLRNLRGSLRLSGLESVKTGSKAQEANLKDKLHLKDLTLQWHDGGINIDDEDEDEDTENVAEQVLGSLQPHTNLHELAIRGYEGSMFPAWMQDSSSLPNLVSLTLDGCCSCTQFPAISHLPSLKFLSVRKMYCVQRLITNNIVHGTTKFPYLELLNLWEMYGLEELFEASEGDCPRLRKVLFEASEGDCPRLRKVCISRCPDLKKLPCIPSVTELVLHCGRELPDIPELASLASLKIEGFHGVKSFRLPALPVLKKVEIRSCKELVSVDGLSALTTVQRLKVADCPKLVLPRTDSLTT